MSNPLLSVCIPAYNGERYLHACMDSVLAQSYGNFELIIVDDGSTDRTLAIAEEYVKKDKRVRVHKKEVNAGLVANWNACAEQATGEWIKFVFQDDTLSPDCLQVFMEYAEKFPGAELLVSKRIFTLEKEVDTPANRNYYLNQVKTLENTGLYRNEPLIPASLVSNTAVKHMSLNFISEPVSAFFKKDCFRNYGKFDLRLKQICDLEFFLRIASHSGIVYVPHALSGFRIHYFSTTADQIREKHYELSCLEPVRMAHILLYGDVYSQFRNQLTFLSGLRLKLYFMTRSYEAYHTSRSDSNLKTQFEETCKSFPNTMKFKKYRFMLYFVYRLLLFKRLLS